MRSPITTVLLTLSRDGILEDSERDFLKRQLEPVSTSAGIASAAKLPTMLAVVVPLDEYNRLVQIQRRVQADRGEELCVACGKPICSLEPRAAVWIGEDPTRESVHQACAQDIVEIELNERRETEAHRA
jgi:hypothetical protein